MWRNVHTFQTRTCCFLDNVATLTSGTGVCCHQEQPNSFSCWTFPLRFVEQDKPDETAHSCCEQRKRWCCLIPISLICKLHQIWTILVALSFWKPNTQSRPRFLFGHHHTEQQGTQCSNKTLQTPESDNLSQLHRLFEGGLRPSWDVQAISLTFLKATWCPFSISKEITSNLWTAIDNSGNFVGNSQPEAVRNSAVVACGKSPRVIVKTTTSPMNLTPRTDT